MKGPQLSGAVAAVMLDSMETTIGTSAHMKIFDDSAAKPANCAAGDPAAVLIATLLLPSDWLANASTFTKGIAGSWTVASVGTGIAKTWRIYDSSGATCHMQGYVGLTGANDPDGDPVTLALDNTNIRTPQTVSVASFTITETNS